MHACRHAIIRYMAQLTVRIDDQLAQQIKIHAGAVGRSVNRWVVAVLSAAINPDFSDSESERTRARLARAGLLHQPVNTAVIAPPNQAELKRIRKKAGSGTPLSKLTSKDRD